MKLFLLYFTLVGVPLLGLLGILRIGETLDVPIAIGGVWSVDPSTAQGMLRSCTPIELPHRRPEMTVVQSGRFVQVRFNDGARTSLSGRLRAGTLTVHRKLPSDAQAERACGASIPAVLQVELQREAGAADQISGSWRIPECAECPPLPFRALRLEAR